MTPSEQRLELWKAFKAADDAWSAALEARFGRQAGDERYTAAAKGQPGSDLRRLYDARRAAADALGL